MQYYRRVQRTGRSSLALSLPKPWAERFKVKPGSTLSVSEQPFGALLVSPKKEERRKAAKFDVSGFDSPAELQRAFIAKYLAGYSVFEFESAARLSPEQRALVSRQAKQLIGLEVVEESEKRVVAQDFFSPDGLSVERGLKRAHSITCFMQETLSALVRQGGEERLAAILERDADVDRLRFLILRQVGNALQDSALLSTLQLTPLECLQFADAVTSLERMADDIVNAAKSASAASAREELGHGIAEFNDFAYSLQVLALKAFLNKSADDANAVLKLYSSLLESRAGLEKRMLDLRAPFQLGMAVDSIALVGNRGKHVAQVAINRAHQGIPDSLKLG